MNFLTILTDAAAETDIVDTILMYIVMITPAITAIGAAIGTIAKIKKLFKDDTKTLADKLDESQAAIDKMEDAVDDVIAINQTLLKENVELKRKLNKVIELETKIKQPED